jgi:hypothetical protein
MGISFGGGGASPLFADIPYLAANFGATGGMAWNVDLADQLTFAFQLDSKLLTLMFKLSNTTVVAPVAGNNLTMKLPNGLLAARSIAGCALAAPGGGALESIAVAATSGSNLLTILRYAANWVAGVDNTSVQGVFIVPVQ